MTGKVDGPSVRCEYEYLEAARRQRRRRSEDGAKIGFAHRSGSALDSCAGWAGFLCILDELSGGQWKRASSWMLRRHPHSAARKLNRRER